MKQLLALPLVLTIAACADGGAKYTPIVDGPRSPAFQSDLASCQALARNQKQMTKQALGKAAIGAGLGAALGEADEDGDAVGGAIAGALAGGATGASGLRQARKSIVIECLRGRGHRVVG
jgi:uncharacterized protein YcfJ